MPGLADTFLAPPCLFHPGAANLDLQHLLFVAVNHTDRPTARLPSASLGLSRVIEMKAKEGREVAARFLIAMNCFKFVNFT